MRALIVDTDVVWFLFKGHPVAPLYQADLTGRALVISFMTSPNSKRWPLEAQWGTGKRSRLTEHVNRIAATALLYGVPLVTHNRDDYRGVPDLALICHA